MHAPSLDAVADTTPISETARDRRRALVLVGVLALTLVAALGFGHLIRTSAAADLAGTPIQHGPIEVRLPEGWLAELFEQEDIYEVAAIDGRRLDDAIVRVRVSPAPTRLDATAGNLLDDASRRRLTVGEDIELRRDFADPPRPTRVAGEGGLIATYQYSLSGTGLPGIRGGQVVLYRTIAAAVVDGLALDVIIERTEWDSHDALLARAIADSLQLRE